MAVLAGWHVSKHVQPGGVRGGFGGDGGGGSDGDGGGSEGEQIAVTVAPARQPGMRPS